MKIQVLCRFHLVYSYFLPLFFPSHVRISFSKNTTTLGAHSGDYQSSPLAIQQVRGSCKPIHTGYADNHVSWVGNFLSILTRLSLMIKRFHRRDRIISSFLFTHDSIEEIASLSRRSTGRNCDGSGGGIRTGRRSCGSRGGILSSDGLHRSMGNCRFWRMNSSSTTGPGLPDTTASAMPFRRRRTSRWARAWRKYRAACSSWAFWASSAFARAVCVIRRSALLNDRSSLRMESKYLPDAVPKSAINRAGICWNAIRRRPTARVLRRTVRLVRRAETIERENYFPSNRLTTCSKYGDWIIWVRSKQRKLETSTS